jgi:uncharacterized lipoprotein NlpE involved in copper resistance
MRAAALLFFCLLGCRDKANKEECTAMTDRYVELSITEDPTLAKLAPEQLAAVREIKAELKRAEKSYQKVKERCADVTRGEHECATAAKTTKDWEACIK